jgi:eukaryotic-like serine/threonine-protein kinase
MVGEKLGSFRIDGTLGVGAMGVVYRATHEPTGKPAAVKVVHKDIAQKGKTYERFQREAEILKQFRHPNIVRFLALGRYQGTSYIAMEYIPGKTLEQVLNERGALPWQEVVELGIQICDALQYAHDHGVIHRDLKPSNLMVTESGTLKLTDFGIAKDLDKTALTATGRTLGTAAYMAPEQIRDTSLISHKTDLYALGIVLYQMLAGQPPFDGSSAVVLMHAHLNEPAPRPSARVAEIPKALDSLVVQLMAKSPSDRPWDAAAVSDALTKIRDKASRGESVAMVWSNEAGEIASPTRAGDSVKKTKKGRKSRGGAASDADIEGKSRRVWLMETAGLVLALAAIAGLFAYMLWPPGMPYLYDQAERLMASTDRHDWYEARDSYLDPLDKRFPDNPYKEKTRAWRDKILLSDTEGRARSLQSQANTAINKPNNKTEERFVEYYTLVSAAQKRYDDLAAIAIWQELASLLRPDDTEERPWFLLAKKRAEELKQAIAQRREIVMKLIARARAAELSGRTAEALTIRADVLTRYGQYTDLADLLGVVPAAPAEPASAPPAQKAADAKSEIPSDSAAPARPPG